MKQYTLKELQEELDVSYSTALKLIKKQEVKATLKKGVYVIDGDSVEDYLKRKEEKKNRKSLTTAVNADIQYKIKSLAVEKGLTVSAYLEPYMEMIATGINTEDLKGEKTLQELFNKSSWETLKPLKNYAIRTTLPLATVVCQGLKEYSKKRELINVINKVEKDIRGFNDSLNLDLDDENITISISQWKGHEKIKIGSFSFNGAFTREWDMKQVITAKTLKTLGEIMEENEK